MPNPYAPDEPPALLWFEQAYLSAVYLGAIAYGIHISVFFACVYYLLKTKDKYFSMRLAFVTLVFALGTLNVSFNMRGAQLVWIDDRNYPGGPLPYIIQQSGNTPLNTAGNAESILIGLLANGLLMYRCYSLYGLWWLLVVPILVWLASFACGILLTIQSSHPNSSLFTGNTLDFSIPYFALSMSLNMLLTLLLISRLLYMRYEMKRALGNDYARLYTTIAVILLESALPYGLISLIFITLYGMKNTAATLFIPLVVQVECISPIVIVMRVAKGIAWNKDTISTDHMTSMKFKKNMALSDNDRERRVSLVMVGHGDSEGSGQTAVHTPEKHSHV